MASGNYPSILDNLGNSRWIDSSPQEKMHGFHAEWASAGILKDSCTWKWWMYWLGPIGTIHRHSFRLFWAERMTFFLHCKELSWVIRAEQALLWLGMGYHYDGRTGNNWGKHAYQNLIEIPKSAEHMDCLWSPYRCISFCGCQERGHKTNQLHMVSSPSITFRWPIQSLTTAIRQQLEIILKSWESAPSITRA